jgi:hypothetical protein
MLVRARRIGIGAEHAVITQLWPQQGLAVHVLMEEQA